MVDLDLPDRLEPVANPRSPAGEGRPAAVAPEPVLTGSAAAADTRLADLAALALAVIEQRLIGDECDDVCGGDAIGEIITTVFGPLDTGGGTENAPDAPEALGGDPGELDRIVKAVREIVGG